jgi:bifunctional non-homologous end joining protein LigD
MSHRVELTNINKIYWPKEKYTKGDLLAYYQKIAPIILPYLKDRPQSLNRYPNGIKGLNFFQKDYQNPVPTFVKTFKFYSESNAKDLRWLVCNNKNALLYLVNLGCIELNPWSGTTKHPHKPDWLVIDLDPDNNSFDQVVQAAQVTHKILDRIGVPNYAKTSGKTGLHVFVPTKAKYTYEQIKQFAEIIANLVHQELPEFTSVERLPKKRKGKIYVDFLQNRLGQTLAAPYSVRPWPGATVSAPLLWREVKFGLKPGQFTMFNIFRRIDKHGDLWRPVLRGPGLNLAQALRRLAATTK